MKIGVISDTHDRMPTLHKALDLFASEKVDAIIHAGDFVAPFAAKPLVSCGITLHSVFGNNDGERAGLSRLMPACVPGPLKLEIAGRSIVVHHWIEQVPADIVAAADVVITGHTHEVVTEQRNGTLLLNPGECCGWLTGEATVAILDVTSLDVRVVTLDKGRSWRPD